MKRIVTLQDISCVGCCSITVALPVISAMGVECGILPTAVLSTHTMFKNFTCKDLSDQIAPISEAWKAEQISFDGIYTGYLASAEQCGQICDFFDQFAIGIIWCWLIRLWRTMGSYILHLMKIFQRLWRRFARRRK